MKRIWRAWRGRRCVRRLAKDESGVAAIEFAMLGLPFFLTIFALVEIGIVFAGELVLDNAVDRIGRDLRTGTIQAAPSPTREEFAELVCEKVSFLFDCDKLVIDLAKFDQYAQAGSRSAKPRYELGQGGDIISLRVDYDWPIVTHILRAAVGKDGTHVMTSMAAFQAERF